ncbi:MAG: hypothetical protein AAGJ68_13015 [Pseudomonadota bacterium]
MVDEKSPSVVGLNHGRMLHLHVNEARRLAHRLLADCMTIRPVELMGDAIEPFFDDLFNFAFHARRITELTDIGSKDEIDKENVFNHHGVEDASSYKYEEILNYIMHCRSISIGLSDWMGNKRWINSKQEKILSFIKIETDWRSKEIFYVFPLVSHFLHNILPKIAEPKPLKTMIH